MLCFPHSALFTPMLSGYLPVAIFLVFDTLAVFLFSWAVPMRALGVGGLLVMTGFVAILALAWIYAYREGLLEWK